MKKIAAVLVAAVVVAGMVEACKPSVGGACTEHAKVCDTPKSRMACISGHYVAESCKGPKGCQEDGKGTTCDSTHGDIGDPCASAKQVVCSTDNKNKLVCEDGKLTFVARCAGEGCTVDDRDNAHCSNPFAREGDTCKGEALASGACSEDGKSELACKGGKMVLSHVCRGAEACTPLTSGPVCDRSTAIPGDPCDPNDPELAVACEASREHILLCPKGKFVMGPRCGGENKCGITTYGIDGRRHFKAGCDQTTAVLGEDCVKDGGLACADDLKSRLVCQNGKFALDKTCKKGCEIHAADGTPFDCKDK